MASTPQQRLVDWFLSQVGYVANADKTNKFAEYMDKTDFYNTPKNGFDWCDITYDCGMVQCFGIDKALKMTNQQRGGGGAGCWISAQCYRDAGQWSYSPQLGAQAFFGPLGDEGHTGCVTRVGDATFDVTEGNTGYSQGYSGGAVLTHTYEIGTTAICGFGIPKWSLARDGEWVKSGERWWWRYPDGTWPHDELKEIDGHKYLFDSKGWMVTGWGKHDGKWYYLNPTKGSHEGQMLASTCVNVGGAWYVLGKDGAMLTSVKTNPSHDGTFGRLLL